MRDFLRTRRLLAKIDREEDVYVILDRMRQAIYDLDDKQERHDERLHALEDEKKKFLTDTGLNRALDDRQVKRLGKWWEAARGPITEMFIKWGAHILWGGILLAASHIVVKGLSKGG